MEASVASGIIERLQCRLAENGVSLEADVERVGKEGAHESWLVHTDLRTARGFLEPGPSLFVSRLPERVWVTILDPHDYDCPDGERLAAYFLQRAEGVPVRQAARILWTRKRWPWG